MPRLLRQDLVRTRARGYAVNWEEAEVGVSAVAARVYGPRLGRRRFPVAAVSVTGATRACCRTASRRWCARRHGR